MPDATERVSRIEAHMDAAVATFREMLPEYGFKLVMSPPLPHAGHSQAWASIWRRGDARCIVHRAAAPSLALLQAAAAERVAQREREALIGCRDCKGLGWVVAVSGAKQMCRHGEG
jgi:hypothetical protein